MGGAEGPPGQATALGSVFTLLNSGAAGSTERGRLIRLARARLGLAAPLRRRYCPPPSRPLPAHAPPSNPLRADIASGGRGVGHCRLSTAATVPRRTPHAACAAVGAGVLSLPFAFRAAGWAGGLLLTLAVAAVEAFTL